MPIRYYLEGVKPGKITLEFSYQKESTSFKHEQEFLVCTQKSRADWLAEITEQIKLETSNAVDMSTYNVPPTASTLRGRRYNRCIGIMKACTAGHPMCNAGVASRSEQVARSMQV